MRNFLLFISQWSETMHYDDNIKWPLYAPPAQEMEKARSCKNLGAQKRR